MSDENEYAPFRDIYDVEIAFEEHVNDIYPAVNVAGLTLDPAEVIARCDETAYRAMFLDWLNNQRRNA